MIELTFNRNEIDAKVSISSFVAPRRRVVSSTTIFGQSALITTRSHHQSL